MHTVTHFFIDGSPLLIYCIVAVVLMLESSAVPIANNTILLFTGALASLGHLNIVVLFLVALLGSIAGACLAYQIGAKGGRRVLLRITAFFHIDDQRIELAERWFQKRGIWMIFLSRMTPYIRPFACFPAGISQMSFARFFLSAFAGSFIWCVALLAIGWYLGKRSIIVMQLMQHYTLPAVLSVFLFIGLCLLIRYAIRQHLRARQQQPAVLE